MRCPACGQEAKLGAKFCKGCGAALKAGKRGGSTGGALDRLIGDAEAKQKELESRIEKLTGEDGEEEASPGAPEPVGAGANWFLGAQAPRAALETVLAVRPGPETTPAELGQVAAFVFQCPFVTGNAMYSDRAGQTVFFPHCDPRLEIPGMGCEVVNAFATDGPVPVVLPGGRRETLPPPVIVFLGGAANATGTASLALAAAASEELGGGPGGSLLPATLRELGREVQRGGGSFSPEQSGRVIETMGLGPVLESEAAAKRARSYAAAMNLGVIAHELGHICLGHTLGGGTNMEISRNQEREADSFASSVASSSPFSDYVVAGGLVWWFILVWVADAGGREVESTHPLPRERLLNFIRANKSQAAELGITEENVVDYLPPE
jgi:hypothetical protein